MHPEPSTRRPHPKRTHILLIDDHPLVRERLAEVIQREPDLAVCGEAEDRHQALDSIRSRKPGLAIVDLTLKNSDGLDLIADMNTRWPDLPILVVSMHDESLYAERALRAGARGYITKQEATRSILRAIRRVLQGDIYLPQHVATEILSRLAGPAAPANAAEVNCGSRASATTLHWTRSLSERRN